MKVPISIRSGRNYSVYKAVDHEAVLAAEEGAALGGIPGAAAGILAEE